MKYQVPTMKAGFSALFSLFVLMSFVLACKNSSQDRPAVSKVEPSPTIEQPKPTSTAGAPRFAVSEVCSLTEKLGQGTVFSTLTGRKWIKDGKGDGEWDYGCGLNHDFYFRKDDSATIAGDYDGIGGKEDVKYITVEYSALNLTLRESSELVHRKEYLEFLNRLSKHLYGVEIPPKAREQILGKKELKKADTGLQVGTGWINLSFGGPAPKAIFLDVHFFESKEAYDKYKDD